MIEKKMLVTPPPASGSFILLFPTRTNNPTMRPYFTVVVTAASFLASSAEAGLTPSTLAKNEANEATAPHSTHNDHRFLRSYEEKDDVDEDRAFEGFVDILKNTRTGLRWRQYLHSKKLVRIKYNEVKKAADEAKKLERIVKKDEKLFNRINALYNKKVSYEDLYKKEKIDYSDLFHALRISDKGENSIERLWWVGYYDYWVKMKEMGVKGG